jgi:hypothetical protein
MRVCQFRHKPTTALYTGSFHRWLFLHVVRRIIRRVSLTDGKSWWEENQAGTRRVVAICSLVALAFVLFLFHSEIKGFFSSHSWWEDTLVVLAGIAVPVLAGFELHHSGEANELRREANRLRAEEVRLQEMIGELEAEKAGHLAQIAANTQRPVSQAERRAAILRKHLGTTVTVSETKGIGAWASPEIVEVREDNVVALFSPHSSSSGAARCVYVHCDDLEIVELPSGSLQLKVLKRYGDTVPLGEIIKWEDRLQPAAAAPAFDKGGMVYGATFNKQGSSETRSLHVFASRDGRNEFLLETGAGEKVIAGNVEISKSFAIFEVNYSAEGFSRSGSGTGGSPYPLYIR